MGIAGFQFISGYQALRDYGEYVQYSGPPDVSAWTSWKSSLSTTMSGSYQIDNITVWCGTATCDVTPTASPKYYTYSTTITLAPLVLRSVLCTSTNPNPCSFSLSYSEQFQ
jgi:hypothetical protein